MILQHVQAVFLTLLLLAGGPLTGRACVDCEPADEPATFVTGHADACCQPATGAPADAPEDRPADHPGCDCPLGCCAPAFAKALAPASPGLTAPAPDPVWDVLPDRTRGNPGSEGPRRPPRR